MDVSQFAIVVQNDTRTRGDAVYPVIITEGTAKRIITNERFQPPGVDAAPLPGDFSLLVPVQRSGGAASAGIIDVGNEPVATPGEHRTYARSSDGTIVSEIHQHDDGKIEVKNSAVTVTILPTGEVQISAAKITVDCPETRFTGKVYAEDVIATDGNVSLNSHITTNVTPGIGLSGPPETT